MSISIGCEYTPGKLGFCVVDSFYQNFYHTGEYFLFVRNSDRFIYSDIPIYVINFNKAKSSLQYKVIRVRLPKCVKCACRNTWFDPVSGKLVHVIERLSTTENEQLYVCDIYYYNIAQFLESDFDEIVVEGKQKAFSLNWNGAQFDEIDHDFGFHDKDGTALIFKAFYNENDHPKCRVDILKLGDYNQILHSNSINLDLTESESLLKPSPAEYLSPGRIFFYDYIEDEVSGDEQTMLIHEYDFEGNLAYRYCIPKIPKENEIEFRNVRNATYVINFELRKMLERNTVQVLKLEKGKVFVVFQLEESRNSLAVPNQFDVIFDLTKRFDQWICLQRFRDSMGRLCWTFSLASLENRQKMLEITESGILKEYFVNWNMNEIARIFHSRDDKRLVFKISRRIISKNMTLKHMARMFVLTSFSEEYLSNQNLPQTLFEYLGIK